MMNGLHKYTTKDRQSYILLTNLIFALYFITAHLGLKMATLNATVSPVWPATGVAIGTILIFGRRYLPAIFIGAFLVNLLTDVSLSCALMIGLGNTLEAWVGVAIIEKFERRNEKVRQYWNTVSIFSASMISSTVSATIGVSALILFSDLPVSQAPSNWITWWTGDSLGGIIIIPLIMVCFAKNLTVPEPRPSLWKILLLSSVGLLLSYVLFYRTNGAPYFFLVFPYLLFCVVMTGIRGLTLATVLLSFFGIAAIKAGYGIFFNGNMNTNCINLQLFLVSMGLCSLVLTDLKRQSMVKRPSWVLVITWLVAGFIFYEFHSHSQKQIHLRFEMSANNFPMLIQNRLDLYGYALQNGASLFAASEEVTSKEWNNFIREGHYLKSLPGAKWIGVIQRVEQQNIKTFVKQQKKQMTQFTYKVFTPGGSALASERDTDAYILTYINPFSAGISRIGYDFNTEEVRKKTMELSRDTGSLQASEMLSINGEKFFLLFFPFYQNDAPKSNVQQRRKSIRGWIFSPVDIRAFFAVAYPPEKYSDINFAIYDQSSSSPIYSSTDLEKLPGTPITRKINIGNMQWKVLIKPAHRLMQGQDDFFSWSGALTAVLSIIVGTFIITLQATRSKAVQEAEIFNERLRESEEMLKLALEGSGDSVWDLNIPEKTVRYNHFFLKMLGYPDTGKLYATRDEWYEALHPEDREKARQDLNEALEKNSPYRSEYRVRCKNGQYKWLYSRGMLIKRDANGKPLRMVGTITDVSSRKDAEAIVENERAKFKAIFDGTSDAILITRNSKLVECNISAVDMFGFRTKKDLLENGPSFLSPLFHLAEDKQIMELELKKSDGLTFPAEITVDSFDYGGSPHHQIAIRDISERRDYETSLRKQREMLIASAKMSSLGEMAGGIAHEINNPLSIIIGKISQLKRLQKRDGDEKAVEDLTLIENTAKRIAAIIKGLKSFSRNAESDEKQKVLMGALLKDLIELSKERFKFHQINLIYEQNSNDQIAVYGRAAQLLQVLVNLLNNAFDAVEKLDEKWVKIEMSAHDGQCVVCITDSGHGIEPRIVEKIMSPFFTTKPVDKGTGLGLSISKNIIEDHDGALSYDGSSGHTRFIIRLPLADETQPATAFH